MWRQVFGFCTGLITFIVSAWFSYSVWAFVRANTLFVCTTNKAEDNLEKAITALDANLDSGLKVAIAIVGAGGAVLLGFPAGADLQRWMKVVLVCSLALFAQAAGAAAWWRMEIAEAWINKCLSLVTEPRLAAKYEASFEFFAAGLGVLVLVLVFVALFGVHKPAKVP